MTLPDQASEKIIGDILVTERDTLDTGEKNRCRNSAQTEDSPEDSENIRHVRGKVPVVVWLLAFTGASQRFAYYGTTIPWREIRLLAWNFMRV